MTVILPSITEPLAQPVAREPCSRRRVRMRVIFDPTMPHALQLILILLAAAVLVVVLCRLVHLPPIVGYLLVGVVVGPHGLGWVEDAPQTRYLGEFGIVFLMFSVGLEFSLPHL